MSKNALIVVDVQNDFVAADGSLSVAGAVAVVPAINREIELAKRNREPIFYTADWHPENTPHFQSSGGIWPAHCIAGSRGAAFFPELVVVGPVVRKGTDGEDGYSGFSTRDPVTGETRSTELEGLLRAAGITHVTVVGVATDYCVKATALDAVRLGFATRVRTDAIAAVDLNPGDGDAALAEMAAAGVELSGPDVEAAA